MKKHILILLALVLGINYLNANPIDLEKAKTVAQKFACFKFKSGFESSDVQLVYTGNSSRNETCFYVFNTGEQGFVIVSADDRFRPIVGYSNEGPFVTENMSPELSASTSSSPPCGTKTRLITSMRLKPPTALVADAMQDAWPQP